MKYFDENLNRIDGDERKKRLSEYWDNSSGFCELHVARTGRMQAIHRDSPASMTYGELHHIKKDGVRVEHEDWYVICCKECHILCEGRHSRAYHALCLQVKQEA